MPGTVHLLTGAALAILIPNTAAMAAVAYFSHFLLDLLPHLDAETFPPNGKTYTFRQRLSLTVDITIVAILFIALYALRHDGGAIALGAAVALLPDLLIPLEGYPAFSPLRRAHYLFHWDSSKAQRWSWFIAALIVPVMISTLSLAVILQR